MAKNKKLGTGAIALIVAGVIVALGSVASLARHNKDDEGTKEEAHVHTYAERIFTQDADVYENPQSFTLYTNVCSKCGEKMEVINAAEVKLGYDLSGYKLRYVEDKKAELAAIMWDGEEGISQIEVECTYGTIGFFDEGIGPWFSDACNVYVQMDPVSLSFGTFGEAGSEQFVYFGGGGMTADTLAPINDHAPLSSDYSFVAHVGTGGDYGGNGVLGLAWSYFEFYYVGEEETETSAASYNHSANASSGESVDPSEVNENGGEAGWTQRY